MQESRFFTPPNVPEMDLRVGSLHGGGSCPSQFWGTTQDGREVYIRYRSGYLSIDVANEPGAEAGTKGNVLDVRLGPPLDGNISSRQIIALTGLQVDSFDGRMDVTDAGDEKDLSGSTTFWNALRLNSTTKGAKRFLSSLRREFADCRISEVSWSPEEDREKRSPVLDDAPSQSVLEVRLGSNCPAITLHYAGFQYDFPGYGMRNGDARLSEKVGRAIQSAGSRQSDLKYDTLMMWAQFPTSDDAARSWLVRLGDAIDAFYTRTEYAPFLLDTGERAEWELITLPDDPAITEWVRSGSDRFRYIRGGGRNGEPLVGYR